MNRSIKSVTREYRRACKEAGMLPDNIANKTSEKKKFPIEGAFHVKRSGKVIMPSDVTYDDIIAAGPNPTHPLAKVTGVIEVLQK